MCQACRRKLPFDAIRGNDPAMLGRDHALSGALAFAALGPSLHVTGSHLAAGVLLTAGAGTLPDIDHPDSTISREFGFLTQTFAWLVVRLGSLGAFLGLGIGTEVLAVVALLTMFRRRGWMGRGRRS